MISPTKVHVRITILKLLSIEPHNNTFTAEFILQATWHDQEANKTDSDNELEVNALEQSRISLLVSNMVVELFSEEDALYLRNALEITTVRYMMRIRAVLSFTSPGVDYPFEKLILPIYITSASPHTEIVFLQDQNPSSLTVSHLHQDTRWILKRQVLHSSYTADQMPHDGMNSLPIEYFGTTHSVLCYRLCAFRKLEYFFFIFFMQQTGLALTSFSVVCLSYSLLHFRLFFSASFLLLSILFKTLTDTPISSHINYHEVFFLITWSVQVVMMLWHCLAQSTLVPSVYNDAIDKAVTFTVFIVCVLLMLLVPRHVRKQFIKGEKRLAAERNSNHPSSTMHQDKGHQGASEGDQVGGEEKKKKGGEFVVHKDGDFSGKGVKKASIADTTSTKSFVTAAQTLSDLGKNNAKSNNKSNKSKSNNSNNDTNNSNYNNSYNDNVSRKRTAVISCCS